MLSLNESQTHTADPGVCRVSVRRNWFGIAEARGRLGACLLALLTLLALPSLSVADEALRQQLEQLRDQGRPMIFGVTLASAPVLDTARPLFAMANVLYESGLCLTSNLAKAVPNDWGEIKPTDKPSLMIDDFSQGCEDWIWVPDDGDWWAYMPDSQYRYEAPKKSGEYELRFYWDDAGDKDWRSKLTFHVDEGCPQ